MTEEEAAQKWCPFARTYADALPSRVPHVASGINRWQDKFGPDTKCLASRCMAWRWHQLTARAGTLLPASGYCGLAGERT